jgi:hypothetical protein
MIVGHGSGNIVRIDEDDVESLMDLSRNAFGVLEQVLHTG